MSPPLVYLMRVTSSIRVGASDDLDRALCGGVGRLGRNGCGVVHRQILKLPVVAELAAWSRGNMANYKVPRSFHIVTDLPRNASGKVLKTELRTG